MSVSWYLSSVEAPRRYPPMKLEFNTESSALYLGVREGRLEQTLDSC